MACGNFSLSKLRQKHIIWTVFVFKPDDLCSFDCFDVYQVFQCYLPENENFRKILGFEPSPPVNVRSGLEVILSVIEKQRIKLLQLM